MQQTISHQNRTRRSYTKMNEKTTKKDIYLNNAKQCYNTQFTFMFYVLTIMIQHNDSADRYSKVPSTNSVTD